MRLRAGLVTVYSINGLLRLLWILFRPLPAALTIRRLRIRSLPKRPKETLGNPLAGHGTHQRYSLIELPPKIAEQLSMSCNWMVQQCVARG